MRISNNGMNPTIYEFGGFRIDPAKRLLIGADDAPIPLMPKAFDTLLYLVEHPGRLLEKSELLSSVWSDTIVEENNLTQNISVLRRALGEKPGEHRFIVTVPGHGYKFVAEVEECSGPQKYEQLTLSRGINAGPDKGRRFGIEKHGNVLALASWARPEVDVPNFDPERNGEVSKIESPVTVPAIGKRRYLAASSVAALALIMIFGIWKITTSGLNAETADGRTFSYLTDGVEVVSPAISPDGNYFAYSSFDGEYTHLWLQQVGQSTRLEIAAPTTMSIGEKTFSPDGQFIYFLGSNENDPSPSLYRMPAFGKVFTKVLGDIYSPVSFSPDGSEMTFSRYNKETSESSIVIARADGSEQRTILKPGNDRFVAYPSWSPDGKLIAVSRTTRNVGPGDSYCELVGIDTKGQQVISLSPEKWASFLRTGWTAGGEGLVFVGTRAGEAFTTRRDQVWYLSLGDGKSTRISNEGFRHEFGGVTRENAVLVQPYDRASQIWAMDVNGDSRSAFQLTSGRSDGRAGLAPLPDGRIGYIARNDNKLELWIVNADGSGKTQVMNEPSQIEELRASPDGKYFIFLKYVDEINQIFRLNVDGSGLEQLTFERDSTAGDPTISPDSRSIVYSAQVAGRGAWLQKVSIDGGPVTAITPKDIAAGTPHFSPDGNLISFVAGGPKIGVVAASGGEAIRIFETPKNPRLNVGARWTPDGNSLAYIVYRNSVSNIWLQPLNGDPPRPLTNFSSGDIYNFAFSNDGSRLLLSRGYGVSNAVLIRNFMQ